MKIKRFLGFLIFLGVSCAAGKVIYDRRPSTGASLRLPSTVSSSETEPKGFADQDACSPMRPLILRILRTCSDQEKYKNLILSIQSASCEDFAKVFFDTVTLLSESAEYKDDPSCLRGFINPKLESLLLRLQHFPLLGSYGGYYSYPLEERVKQLADLAVTSPASRESFMKMIPKGQVSNDLLFRAIEIWKGLVQEKKYLSKVLFDRLESRQITDQSHWQPMFDLIEKETGLKQTKWSVLARIPTQGCGGLDSIKLIVPTDELSKIHEDKIAQLLMATLADGPIGGEFQIDQSRADRIVRALSEPVMKEWTRTQGSEVAKAVGQIISEAKRNKFAEGEAYLLFQKAFKHYPHKFREPNMTECD